MNSFTFPETLKRTDIKAFFTTKKTGTDVRVLSRFIGESSENIYSPIQRHTDDVQVLRYDMERKVADAVLTRRKKILLGIAVADCVPILLYDPVRMVCGAVHAGWRGTAGGILVKTLSHMTEEFYSDTSDILLAIGPAIRWCCYTVGRDVLDAVCAPTGNGEYYEERDGNICLDLPTANKIQATSFGVNELNIWMSDECTYCHPLKYYSYRYAKGVTGRQGGFIGMFV